MNKLNLGTIEEEAAACRAAWAAKPRAKYGVHIHHEELAELLFEPIESRLRYILRDKPENERALRLHLMRPITEKQWKAYDEARATAVKAYNEVKATAWKAYYEALNKAHRLVCTTPGCPYKNGSIF